MNILFFLQPGTNSRSTFEGMIEGARELGHNCLVWELGPIWSIYARAPQAKAQLVDDVSSMVAAFIKTNRIDLSVTMWANSLLSLANPLKDGRPVSLFDYIGSPHLCLWLDSPERAHQGGVKEMFKSRYFDSPCLFHWMNNAASAREMTDVYGFGNVIPRSYGIDPKVFKPDPSVAKEYDVVYSGGGGCVSDATDVMREEIAKDDPDMMRVRTDLVARIRPALEEMAGKIDGARPVAAKEFVRRLLATQLTDRATPVLDRVRRVGAQDSGMGHVAARVLAEPTIFAELAEKVRWLEDYDRAMTYVYLSRFFKCAMFGKVDYSAFGLKTPSVGFVGWEEQATWYSRGKVGLSVMRWQDEEGLHVKPYEITASGAACAAQHRPGIEKLFEVGKEIVTFNTPREARDVIGSLIGDPVRLKAVTEAGRARTLRDHTTAACMRDLIDGVMTRWNAGRGAGAGVRIDSGNGRSAAA